MLCNFCDIFKIFSNQREGVRGRELCESWRSSNVAGGMGADGIGVALTGFGLMSRERITLRGRMDICRCDRNLFDGQVDDDASVARWGVHSRVSSFPSNSTLSPG